MSQVEKARQIAEALGMPAPEAGEPIGDFYLDALLRIIKLLGLPKDKEGKE